MRVALVTDGIWPYVLGGMQKHSYYLCKCLAANGIKVDLFHYNNSNFNIDDLEFFSTEEKANIRSVVLQFPSSARFPGHYLYKSFKYSKRVYDAILPTLAEYDLIYSKGFSAWHLINQKAKGNCTCAPIGIKFHGYEMFQKAPDLITALQFKFLLQSPVKSLSNKADVVFSYGGKITALIKSIGVPASKIIELPTGIDEEQLAQDPSPSHTKRKLLYLGRYERRKGIEELNTVLKNISNTNLEVGFIGPIPIDKQLQLPYIKYYGEMRDRQSLMKAVREHDALICPSWSEGMPNVILEAMAGGLTVIATDVGASGLLVNNANGWLIADSSPASIKQAIERFLSCSDSELQNKKQQSLNHIRNNFTWKILGAAFIQAITSAARK